MLSITYPTRNAKKPGSGNTEVALLSLATFPEPFASEHPTDAHFWPYVAYVNGKVSDVQISVPVAGRQPKAIASNEAVMMHYVVLDWDKHQPTGLSAADREEFMLQLAKLPVDSIAAKFAVFHWTKNGCRIIYRLGRPMDWSRYGEKVRGMCVEIFRHTDLQMDPTCDQWWRCFRLPRVVRDGIKQSEQPWFECFIDSETTVDPDSIQSSNGRLPWDKSQLSMVEVSGKVPNSDAAYALCSPNFVSTAKKLLKSAGCYSHLFEGVELRPGTLDSAMLRFPGQVVARLFNRIEYLTPEHVFGLLLPLATYAPDMPEKLWRCTQHAWNQEAEKKVEREQRVEVAKDRKERLIAGLLANYDEALIPDSPDDQARFAMSRLVLVKGSSHYCPDATGTYQMVPLRAAQVPAQLREVIGEWFQGLFNTKGDKVKTASELLADYSHNIDRVQIVPAPSRGLQVVSIGGLEVLNLNPYQIRPEILANASRDADVDLWLTAWGERAYAGGRSWLAWAAALEEGPICALSLKGAKKTGKTMLALALAELFGTAPCPGSVAFSRFNSPLLWTPFVLVDEGLPRKLEGMSVPDQFRSMVTGTGFSVEMKGLEPIYNTTPIRFMLCGNNNDIVTTLAGGKILTRDDVAAVAERTMHVTISLNASLCLSEHGDMAWTKRDPKGPWIGGDPANGGCRLARHIAYLYLKRHEIAPPAGRLLVEGTLDPSVMALLESGGLSAEVAAVICDDVNKLLTAKVVPLAVKDNLTVVEGQLWFRKQSYVRRIVEALNSGSRTNGSSVRRVMDRWCTGAERSFDIGGARAQWWELSARDVLEISRVEGLDCTGLNSILAGELLSIKR